MLRLFRFEGTLGFTGEARTVGAVAEMGERLEIVSAERIRDELSKLVVAPDAGKALDRVVASGLATHFLPELPALAMEQDPRPASQGRLGPHAGRGRQDTARGGASARRPVPRHRQARHPPVRKGWRLVPPSRGRRARLTRRRLKALRYPGEVVADVSRLVFLHLRPHTLKMGWTDSAVRRYVRDAGELLPYLNELVRCDVTTANPRRARAVQNPHRRTRGEDRRAECEGGDIASPRPDRWQSGDGVSGDWARAERR